MGITCDAQIDLDNVRQFTAQDFDLLTEMVHTKYQSARAPGEDGKEEKNPTTRPNSYFTIDGYWKKDPFQLGVRQKSCEKLHMGLLQSLPDRVGIII